MPLKILRNDITKMKTDAIVNTANARPTVGPGCERAVYEAAGYEALLAYRREKIGCVLEGEVFVTPGFGLAAKYIIHAVSPHFIDGGQGEETLLRNCYRRSLAMAEEMGLKSVAFPLISTGNYGYPREEGLSVAVEEIRTFLLKSEMQVFLVVFDEQSTQLGRNLAPGLEAYIDANYVAEKTAEEYEDRDSGSVLLQAPRLSHEEARRLAEDAAALLPENLSKSEAVAAQIEKAAPPQAKRPKILNAFRWRSGQKASREDGEKSAKPAPRPKLAEESKICAAPEAPLSCDEAIEEMERNLAERMKHLSDSFPEYLLYLIEQKGMENAEVYKRAIVDKKVFSKIKNNPYYHPQKLTALCLCVGARLNMDESRDLLARAGYAFSPCDKTDVIFSFFIENGIYDMIELDIQLEEHGLPCVIR